jgi:electron transfer flavoprotein alpha subunit
MDFSYLDDWQEEEPGPALTDETAEGYRNIWVVAEVSKGALTRAALATLGQARELADQIGVYVYGILLGEDVQGVAQSLITHGADKVLVADNPALADYQPSLYGQTLAGLVERYRPEILLMAASAMGNDLAPWLAQRLNTGLISHCIKLDLDMSERLLLVTFPVLGGEVYHTVACPDARPQMATLQPGHFPVPYEDTSRYGDVQPVDIDPAGTPAGLAWTELGISPVTSPAALSKARTVVAAGRGMGDAGSFALVERLAQYLGGVVAGSRGAYDEGWIAEEQIVGAGGELISPDLYIACGISGDVYHTFGLQNARFVVAINSDPEAPIMQVANIAVLGDAPQVVNAILDQIAG